MPQRPHSKSLPMKSGLKGLNKVLKAVGLTPASTTANTKPTTLKDHDQIKAIIEPFRQIWMTVLENVEHDCVKNFFTAQKGDITHYYVTIATDPNGDPTTAKGRAAFPLSVPYELQIALVKLDQCDRSVFCFLSWIQEALRPIGATAEWVILYPSRHTKIHVSSDPDHNDDVLHSVFAITTANREHYYADFTQEQFGFDATDWFAQREDYLARHAYGIARISSHEDETHTGQQAFHSRKDFELGICIYAACEEISWPAYRRLPVDERASWVDAHTRRIIEGNDIDKLWKEGWVSDDNDKADDA